MEATLIAVYRMSDEIRMLINSAPEPEPESTVDDDNNPFDPADYYDEESHPMWEWVNEND